MIHAVYEMLQASTIIKIWWICIVMFVLSAIAFANFWKVLLPWHFILLKMRHMSLKTKVTEINLVQNFERNETSSSFMMFLYLVPLDNNVILTLLFCKQLNMSPQRNVLTNLGNVSYYPDVERYKLLNSRSLNKKFLPMVHPVLV